MAEAVGIPLGSFAGTLLGVLLGESIAIAYDRYRRAEDEGDRRENAARSMYEELGRVAGSIDAFRSSDPDARVEYPSAAYRSSVSGGTFALFDAGLQDRVSRVYALVQEAEERQRELRVARAEGSGARTTELRREFAGLNDELEAELPDVRDALGEHFDA